MTRQCDISLTLDWSAAVTGMVAGCNCYETQGQMSNVQMTSTTPNLHTAPGP